MELFAQPMVKKTGKQNFQRSEDEIEQMGLNQQEMAKKVAEEAAKKAKANGLGGSEAVSATVSPKKPAPEADEEDTKAKKKGPGPLKAKTTDSQENKSKSRDYADTGNIFLNAAKAISQADGLKFLAKKVGEAAKAGVKAAGYAVASGGYKARAGMTSDPTKKAQFSAQASKFWQQAKAERPLSNALRALSPFKLVGKAGDAMNDFIDRTKNTNRVSEFADAVRRTHGPGNDPTATQAAAQKAKPIPASKPSISSAVKGPSQIGDKITSMAMKVAEKLNVMPEAKQVPRRGVNVRAPKALTPAAKLSVAPSQSNFRKAKDTPVAAPPQGQELPATEKLKTTAIRPS